MMKMVENVKLSIIVLAILAIVVSAGTGAVIYETNFDALALGPIQNHPGAEDQGYWYSVSSNPGVGSIGQIQNSQANGVNALNEHISHLSAIYSQTEDGLAINPIFEISSPVFITLSCDFYAHSSDLTSTDFFNAHIDVAGGPHPGYKIIGFGINSGNGSYKNERKLDVNFAAYNGSDNNYVFSPVAGRALEWDIWHSISVKIDQLNDCYVSITVDGVTEYVSGHPLPRSYDSDVGQWKRGQIIDKIGTGLLGNGQSDDDIYWDNIMLKSECSLRADINGDCAVNLEDFTIMASEWLLGI